jgi:hypothetical protein
MMQENDCGCIPVVNNLTEKKPVGTITDRDITIRTVAASNNPINMKASDIMTTNIATVKPNMSVEECFDVMEDREIRRVLVVDEMGKCCGIVAQADVVQSDASPIRTTKVIREISESSPSRNLRVPMSGRSEYQNYEEHSSRLSFMSGSSLLPLLIGLGSGAALTYWLGSRRGGEDREYGRGSKTAVFIHENRQDLTDQKSFGKYVDAEREIEQRQHHLEDRFQALRTEPDSPLNKNKNEESMNREEEPIPINTKKRGAQPH